eukprot:gene7566-8366_t
MARSSIIFSLLLLGMISGYSYHLLSVKSTLKPAITYLLGGGGGGFPWKNSRHQCMASHAHPSPAPTTTSTTSTSSPQPPKLPRKFVPQPFDYHHEMDLVIEDLTNLGYGVGRVPLADGKKWVVMVPNVLIGEKVRVRIYSNYDSYSEADLVTVLTPSEDRVTPACPHYQLCGGCQYQHATLSAQRKWKKDQVVNVLQRIGGIVLDPLLIGEVQGSEHAFGYRSKITPHFNLPKPHEDVKIGFQQRNSHRIVDIPSCLIATPAINEKYREERERVQKLLVQSPPKRGATLLLREADGGHVETSHKAEIKQTVLNKVFMVKAGEFFQNNPYVLPLLVQHVLKEAIGSKDCRYLIDTYCGSGLFAICAAESFEAVYGVEVSDEAVRCARKNALGNGLTNAHFLSGSAEAIFGTVEHLHEDETVIIIDPPRKGCDESFLSQLFAFFPRRLVYVSCDPATQARDAKAIVAAGYSIKQVLPFDLFPQTRHIENVITFERPC